MSRPDALDLFHRHHDAMRWLLRVMREARDYGYTAEAIAAVRHEVTASRLSASRALTHLR